MKKWHVHIGVGALAVCLAVLVAFLVGAFAGPKLETVFGTKLNADGQKAYSAVSKHGESGLAQPGEALPPALAAKVAKANAALAAKLAAQPHTAATPQPVVKVAHITTNYSSRNGAHPILLVAHDTESPNEPGLADDLAIRAWFNNPRAQASANDVVDGAGNTIELVPDTLKAWHVAYFNPWAFGVEQVGYATQTSWPLAQLEATARIFAHEATKWGIPIQRGKVSGCRIVTPGIVEHADLGLCGGGHHDPGAHYPLAKLIALTKMYADAGKPHPAPKPVVHKPLKPCKVKAIQFQLNRHGATPKLKLDGVYGPKTKAALAHYERTHKTAIVKGCKLP